jgi:hypothetical protein
MLLLLVNVSLKTSTICCGMGRMVAAAVLRLAAVYPPLVVVVVMRWLWW